MKTVNPLRSGLALMALAMLLASSALPALARDSYVTDNAGLFSDATVASLNQQIGDFNQQTGKEVVVVTVPSLDGQTLQDAAEKTFAQQQVNGVLIYLAKAERQDMVLGDKASRAFFAPGAFTTIHDAMRGYFRQGDFDGGIKTGVNLVIAQYRSHQRIAPNSGAARTYPITKPVPSTATQSTSRGSHMSFFWLLIILLAGFLIIRALFRAISGPRMMPPGAGPGGPAPGPGYGPGYGPGGGYGYGGGGGGSFFSGLLGGLGGAWLGNELFNRGGAGGQTIVQDPNAASAAGGGWGDSGGGDASGWQSDAGQADMGNAGGGDWGGGGGFDAGGGGDFGGGGGFDSGGGGGDSGGGW
jgi:uncharacterized membrane protein YgcG